MLALVAQFNWELKQLWPTEVFEYAGKAVVITGGSRGLGFALARRLVQEGAAVTLLARDGHELEEANRRLLALNPEARVLTCVCDVTNQAQLAAAVRRALDQFGSIDVWINNAGAISVGPFDSMTRKDFEAQMNLHLYATIEATKIVLPHFRQRGQGRFVNICSLGGRVAVPHMLPYDTSKFALSGFSQGLASELAPEGIHVTTIYPTLMRTGSPKQAVFKGDHEKEYLWFAAGDAMPGLSMSADTAARKILQAAAIGRKELMPTLIGRLRMLVAAVTPETLAWGMSLMARALPKGQSLRYKTGAQSRRLFENSRLLEPLRTRAHEAEEQFNQMDKTNPKFNLGVH